MEQASKNRENQKRWYNQNRAKVKDQKKTWYERNREHALAKNREWRLKKHEEEQQIKKSSCEKSKQNIGLSLFQILDILRKDVRHYLWGKSVINWNETDWHKFNQLR